MLPERNPPHLKLTRRQLLTLAGLSPVAPQEDHRHGYSHTIRNFRTIGMDFSTGRDTTAIVTIRRAPSGFYHVIDAHHVPSRT